MKTLSPKVQILVCVLLLNVLGTTSLFAQSIRSGDNGKIAYHYNKNNTGGNGSSVVLVYKNDQYIYTPEIDSVVFNSNEALQYFISDLKKGIASLDQKDSSFNQQRTDCRLYKYVHSMNGAFVSMSNASGSVVTSQNKFEAQQLLDWLLAIQWGKE